MAMPWTVLAYMVADDRAGLSPLDQAVKSEIRELCAAADRAGMNVAIQVDFKNTPGIFRATLRRVRDFEKVDPSRYDLWDRIAEQARQSELTLQKERRDLNSADPRVLKQFLQWGRRELPAKRYLIFFFGHSFGPMGLFYDSISGRRVAAPMRLNQLEFALDVPEGPADIVIFRDCYMNTLETAYELQGVVRFVIATQALAPIKGQWPWSNLFMTLLTGGDTELIARALVDRLGTYFEEQKNRGPFADVPYTLLAIDSVRQVTDPLKNLVRNLENVRNEARVPTEANAKRLAACTQALEGARIGSPTDPTDPGDPALLDVLTLCRNFQALVQDPLSSIAKELAEIIGDRVVRWHTSQDNVFFGTSLYYTPVTKSEIKQSFVHIADPTIREADAAYYGTLELSKATGWNQIALWPLSGSFVDTR